MKIIIEHEDQKFTAEDDTVTDIHDAFILIYHALMGIGFHPESVKAGVSALDEEVNPDNYKENTEED